MNEILVYSKVLLILWSVNLAPPLLAYLLGDKWNRPVDLGRPFRDGRHLLGAHKTVRGVAGGTLAGLCAGWMVGWPWWVGLLSGVFSMTGDMLSSFLKRRLALPNGSDVAGLDQALEGALPFLVLKPYVSLSSSEVYAILLVFCGGAYVGSWFHQHILLKAPLADYPRPLKAHVRLRELRRCQMLDSPLRYLLNFEEAFYYHFLMKSTFRALGVYEKGKVNALNVMRRTLTFHFPDLPSSFEDYTILYMSDLHLDGLPGLNERITSIVREIRTDLCIIGGDFRMETYGPFDKVLCEIRNLIPHVHTRDGVFGILGNHDCLEMVKPLEMLGIRFLINDARSIERNGEKIWIVGIDDPHHFQCHDLGVAFEDVPLGAFSIFLAHSNEVYREAAKYEPRLYLCGHSHGGQICIPVVGPVFTHSRAPRRLCHGEWHHEGMVGYTSCGVGVSGVPVRFSTQGEILVITLKR